MGEEKFDIIQKCDLAILNPTGYTEAFPASPLECMACGVPVIASDDHGMSDCMRFFPELVLRSPQDIVHRVEWLVADPLRYLEIQHRAIAIAQWFHLQRAVILTRWIRLLEAILDSTDTKLDLAPMLPFYGSRRKLMIRRDIRPRLSVAKRLILSPLKALGVRK
ncbi:glycosyltransferase [Leptolyngbya sp. O-77]|uniref:glycosyltransferase n=1 Tax=Leptolyngbya sp. O-77 TaxID=1080068 RepID=UPI00074D2FD0|nr:glycosyltransferase [Leptolyngbya sp. O-77]BAU43991.1 Glycosyl transferases group 1 [Leptolyngbya sp. O-77]